MKNNHKAQVEHPYQDGYMAFPLCPFCEGGIEHLDSVFEDYGHQQDYLMCVECGAEWHIALCLEVGEAKLIHPSSCHEDNSQEGFNANA